MLFWNGSLGKTPPWSPSDAESIHRKLTAYGELKRDLVGMGQFKSDTARHQDPRKQRADPSARPCGRVRQGAGGVASSLIATADVRAVGLCSGADPPGSWAHAIVARHHARPGYGRKSRLGSRSSAAAILSPWSREHGEPPALP